MNHLSSAISIVSSEFGDPDTSIYQFESSVEQKTVELDSDLRHQPSGLNSLALKANIKYPDVLDFAIVALNQPGTAAGVFTRNRSASPAVKIDREHLENGEAQALVVLSKNANVFTPTAYKDAVEIVESVAKMLNMDSSNILLSCTGVIGVPLPMDNVRKAISRITENMQNGLIDNVSEAIMTTDKGPKIASVKFGDVVISGMAKGAGMIEPNMATMLVYFFTNLDIDKKRLKDITKRVCDSTFNSISVDTDTSTSDSVIVYSTNEIEATESYLEDFEKALGAIALKLSRDIIYQSEGATKLVEVTVKRGRTEEHAKQVAKLIINSPLVKTAIFGADPNWGRIVMAMGKPLGSNESTFDTEKISIAIAGIKMFDYGQPVSVDLAQLSSVIKDSKHVDIVVELGEGDDQWTVWGCDLSYKYVEINAEYTT